MTTDAPWYVEDQASLIARTIEVRNHDDHTAVIVFSTLDGEFNIREANQLAARLNREATT